MDEQEYVVEFDFLGKDSIRYYNKIPVEKRVRVWEGTMSRGMWEWRERREDRTDFMWFYEGGVRCLFDKYVNLVLMR